MWLAEPLWLGQPRRCRVPTLALQWCADCANARAAVVRNPRAAVYLSSLATGLSAEMPRDVALLYAGASQAGGDFCDLLSGEAPNATIVLRAVRKRLAEDAAEKRIAQVPGLRVDSAVWVAAARPSECKFPLPFCLVCAVSRHVLFLARCAVSQPVHDLPF